MLNFIFREKDWRVVLLPCYAIDTVDYDKALPLFVMYESTLLSPYLRVVFYSPNPEPDNGSNQSSRQLSAASLFLVGATVSFETLFSFIAFEFV